MIGNLKYKRYLNENQLSFPSNDNPCMNILNVKYAMQYNFVIYSFFLQFLNYYNLISLNEFQSLLFSWTSNLNKSVIESKCC